MKCRWVKSDFFSQCSLQQNNGPVEGLHLFVILRQVTRLSLSVRHALFHRITVMFLHRLFTEN